MKTDTADAIDISDYDLAFPPMTEAEVRAMLGRAGELLRFLSQPPFPGATAAEAGRAAERVGRVDPFN